MFCHLTITYYKYFDILARSVDKNSASSIVLRTADHTKLADMARDFRTFLDGNTIGRIRLANSAPHSQPVAPDGVPYLLRFDSTYHVATLRTHAAG